MKEVWVTADPWSKELVTTALEAGADAVIVPPDKVSSAKELGLIKTVSDDGDLKWGKDVVNAEITSAADEERILRLCREKRVVVKVSDWKIIPLENLLARASNIMVEVEDLEEAKTAAGILERGVDGLIINQRDPLKVREIIHEIKRDHQALPLVKFQIAGIRPLGMGDRVCIDTCSMLKAGEGSLIGNSSRALFLVHAETIENPYVSPRPFRINAGPVHAYVMTPGGRTRYLSELRAGDEVVGINPQGRLMTMVVGRVKIERRPMLLVSALGPNGEATVICQNAETICLVQAEGNALSVVQLKPGDEVLGYVEDGGRHFGHHFEETVIEQ